MILTSEEIILVACGEGSSYWTFQMYWQTKVPIYAVLFVWSMCELNIAVHCCHGR